jgi:hypothetical protein
MAVLAYYLFWHFFQYELLNVGDYAEEEEISVLDG